jgi:carbamoyl-phosphate synthase large subunit
VRIDKPLPNLLVSSSGRKSPLLSAAQDAIDRFTGGLVWAGDLSAEASFFSNGAQFWQMPETVDECLTEIIDGCIERGIGYVLPTRDGELSFWSRNRSELESSGISVIVSSPSAIELLVDKLFFYERLTPMDGVNLIPTSLSSSSFDGSLLVVKERYGSGSKGIGVGLNHQDAKAFSLELNSPIFQPLISGNEISVDAWFSASGTLGGLVTRRRTLVIDGESKVTETFRSDEIEEAMYRALSALGSKVPMFGPIVAQAFVSEGIDPTLIEVNARFGGASTSSLKVGLDSIYWSLCSAVSGSELDIGFVRSDFDVRQTRLSFDSVETL